MKQPFVSSAVLAGCLLQVEGFLPRGVPVASPEISSLAEIFIQKKNPFSASASRRSRSTLLRYRNSPHDTQVDYYNILGIPRTANAAEIKRAYRTLAKRFHPDANSDMDTTEIFQQLNRAYEVLKDDDLRFQFDKFGSDGIKNSYSSDSTVRSYNVKKPDEVYYHSEANPFSPLHGTTYYQYPPQSRPDVGHGARPHFHNSQSPPPHNAGVPNGRRPYREESWDPWKSPFADIYDAQIRNGDYYAYDPYAPLDTSSFKGRDPSFGFGNINTSHQKVGPYFQHTHGMPRYARSNGNINTGHQNVNAGGPANRSPQGSRRQTIGETMDFYDTNSPPTSSSGSGSRRRWVGEDICIEMEIDYEKALKGGEEKIRIKRLEACSTCDGDGIQPGAEIETCKHCGGSGAVLHKAAPVGMSATDNFSGHKVCHHCRGTGQTVAENCGTCHGRGIKQTSKEMTLVIPPGVTDKSKLRLKGEGDVGPLNGPAGDLFVFLKVKHDRSHSVY